MKGKQSKDCQPSSLAKRESHTQVQSQMLLECSGTEEFVPFAGPAPSLRPLDEKSSVRKLQGGVRTHMVAFHSFQFISRDPTSWHGIVVIRFHAGPGTLTMSLMARYGQSGV